MRLIAEHGLEGGRGSSHRTKRTPGRGSKNRGYDLRSLEEQVARAAAMQRSLLPDLTDPVEGFRFACAYRPCEPLAGDFYDIFRDRGRVTLIVADVMCHGLGAALLTMLVKAVFHDMAPVINEIPTLLWVMNGHLQRLIPEGSYVAAIVLRLERGASAVEFSNAGMPYPIVLRSRSQRTEELRSGGVPLGLDVQRAASYELKSLELEPGDVLLVRSDGLASIESRSGVAFGDHQMRQTVDRLPGLPVEKVIEVLMEEALQYGRGCAFEDDVNLIAVSRVSPGPASKGRRTVA
jgi:sigma-B regulation protein RsbU (phosphoserine phosphatase)